jgi:catechol 2,3-dioxygenase-like lactoylglutathione lyase family enzyme
MRLRILALAALAATPLFAQLAPANEAGVTMGLVHLTVRDPAANERFWVSMLGGKVVHNGPLTMIQFPGVYIVLRKGEPTGAAAGSVVDHFGFVVKDVEAELAKWKAGGVKVEQNENPKQGYVIAPDGMRIEFFGDPSIPTGIQMNHIHFFTPDIPGMKAWYVKTFGGNPAQRSCVACVSKPRMIEDVEFPGMNLSVAGLPDGEKTVAPTKGRSLDHIGFEVKNLEAFSKKLESQGVKFDSPVKTVRNTTIKVAFLTDPWGTYIELTEKLDPR